MVGKIALGNGERQTNRNLNCKACWQTSSLLLWVCNNEPRRGWPKSINTMPNRWWYQASLTSLFQRNLQLECHSAKQIQEYNDDTLLWRSLLLHDYTSVTDWWSRFFPAVIAWLISLVRILFAVLYWQHHLFHWVSESQVFALKCSNLLSLERVQKRVACLCKRVSRLRVSRQDCCTCTTITIIQWPTAS